MPSHVYTSAEFTAVARATAERFGALPGVVAVVWAGSQTTRMVDASSDIDLYVYAEREIPPAERAALLGDTARALELDNRFWEPGDEWLDAASGIHLDVMYRSPQWIREQIERVLVRHEASVGYSTCFWANVLASEALVDPQDWFAELRAWADQPYPEPLVPAIIAKNHPILRDTHSSYRYQLASAAARGDSVSLNHRAAALLASYFDILFAVNRLPHPGEKRLLTWATRHCPLRPPEMAAQVAALLAAAAPGGVDVLAAVDALLDDLDALLRAEGWL